MDAGGWSVNRAKAYFSTMMSAPLHPFDKSSLNCSFGPAPGHHGCLVGSPASFAEGSCDYTGQVAESRI